MHLSRRNVLRAAIGSGVAIGCGGLGSRLARAAENQNLVLAVYFSGGWDQLLAFDPRPTNASKYSGDAPYQPGGSGIHPAYETIGDGWMTEVLSKTGGTGVQDQGELSFGPAVPDELLAHASDLSIVRGINMGTLTHEVGRRFFTTGQFPRGLSPVGSSLSSLVASVEGAESTIPNLSIDTESYAIGLPAFASPIQVRDGQDVRDMLRVLGPELAYGKAALLARESSDPSCRSLELDGDGSSTLYRASRAKAATMVVSGQDTLFDFNAGNPGVNEDLFDQLGIATSADLSGEKGSAAIAAQALTKGVSRAVSVRLAANLDTHFDWATDHPNVLRDGLAVLGNLIAWLKRQASPFGDGGTTWDHTTLMCFSEFARTPLLNGRDGRDHHLASSCLVAGPGIRRGIVVGGTSDAGMAARSMELDTGEATDGGGASVGPGDVIKTVLTSIGMSDLQLGNQPLNVVSRLLP